MTAIPGRSWRRLAALLLVLLGSLPFLVAADRVEVEVDGEVLTVRTYADTVADVLEDTEIEVGPDDRVVPDLAAPLSDGTEVTVLRARRVAVFVQGEPRFVEVIGDRVQDVLIAAGLDHVDPSFITPGRWAGLAPSQTVQVLMPLHVRIVVDGRELGAEMPPGLVVDALAAVGVELGPDDRVLPPLTTRLTPGMDILVNRIGQERMVDEVLLPFATTEVQTDDLLVGTSDVAAAGREGVREDVYRLELVDGEEVSRELVSSVVVREPRAKVVRIGTREPEPEPAPETAPAPAAAPERVSAEGDDVWYRLADCESGGNWGYDGAYDGGLQFHPSTWNTWKPSGYPDYAYQATAQQQITVGRRLQAARGWSPWPSCARKLGLQ